MEHNMMIRYKRFCAEITPKKQQRKTNDGRMLECDGFAVIIYADTEKKLLLEQINIAVGYELLTGDDADIEQFVKDYIDSEEKEYCRILDESEGYN